MKRLYILVLVIFCVVVSGSPASLALQSNTDGQLFINAVVPPMRVIYVDDQDNIVKVAGNTSANIEPEVLKGHQPVAMTSYILLEYQQILEDNGDSLQAGVIYKPHPTSLLTRFIKTSVLRLPLIRF